MTLLAMKHSVQLLSDARGIYGVGVVDSAVEDDRCRPPEIILRPDRLLQARHQPRRLANDNRRLPSRDV